MLSLRKIGAVVLLAGVGGLALEICAARMLAPYFGQSTLVWANIIGLILIYLSSGYWLGGRFADRYPDPRVLGYVILTAAAYIAVLPFLSRPVLEPLAHGVLGLGIVTGSFSAVLALFSFPVILLGTVTPWALRLALSEITNSGTVAGKLYSLSTMGSIAGTFIPALVTIPLIGTQRTVIGTSILLAIAAMPLLHWRAGVVAIIGIVLLVIPPSSPSSSSKVLFQQDSQYQYIRIVENNNGARYMVADAGFGFQSVWNPSTVLTGEYFDGILLGPALVKRSAPSVLVLGVAGGTVPRAFAKFYPQARIDGVELDHVALASGGKYMGVASNPNLNPIEADGRVYLETTDKHYDLIIVDTYHELSMPFYMVTQEFFQLLMSHLNPGGMVILNVADISNGQISGAVSGTLATVSPQTLIWNISGSSYLVMGLKQPTLPAELATRLSAVAAPLNLLVPLFTAQVHPVAAISDPMTDDRAPIEWMLDQALLNPKEVAAPKLPTDPSLLGSR